MDISLSRLRREDLEFFYLKKNNLEKRSHLSCSETPGNCKAQMTTVTEIYNNFLYTYLT